MVSEVVPMCESKSSRQRKMWQSRADYLMADREGLEQDVASKETRDHLLPTSSNLLLSPPPNNAIYYESINILTYSIRSESQAGIVSGDLHKHSQSTPLISWAPTDPISTVLVKLTRLTIIVQHFHPTAGSR